MQICPLAKVIRVIIIEAFQPIYPSTPFGKPNKVQTRQAHPTHYIHTPPESIKTWSCACPMNNQGFPARL
ncbi:hypothetical protein VTL71DRAFT_4079 [Oculimacula yallundae]|uniref:Uncharacterized protein n=1 Tax=Oculimacula yallundae TaxID=86028 RepID=A0ABR4C6N3_9HELO